MKPNIVFVINYFYPDYASTGQILTELCLHLQHDFNITVIAARPGGYNEQGVRTGKRVEESRLENIRILHIALPNVNKNSMSSRLRYIAAYFFQAVLLLLRQRKVDFVYTISQPPILGGTIGTIGKWLKRAKHIYNIQDFNPEQAEAVGFSSPLMIKLARAVDIFNCRMATHIITVGYDMKETLEKRFNYHKVPDNTVIHNWTNEEEIVPLPKTHPRVADFIAAHGLEGKFIVMYSGNLGLYYDLENLVRYTDQFRDFKDMVFVFIGDGAVKKKMQQVVEKLGVDQVRFLPYQPKEDLVYSLNAADVHLVVNQKGIKGVSVPSKIYGVMAAGKPVLGVLEEGSEAYRLIELSGNGMLVEPQQYDQFVKSMKNMYLLDREQLRRMGGRGRTYLEKHLRRETSMEKYRVLLRQLADSPKPHTYSEMEVPR
ncbi:glycosyltransferase family 4 protein [Paenibacillus sp. JX-17]|uniref:Glycosyltransferase family 4 protein n=1 Tax=Paenibacillus lacisoli TaxID=3064525 RepID=A0ABT9CD89_9BACL|nr:glycosyltransferase family 4 protein [Paenibacillus sp. JX-17]MDO7907207.1 glycosyltransferase family 4 protein [Paenibacillus sp. JX-17]